MAETTFTAEKLSTNIIVFFMILLLVVVLPLLDRLVCRGLGVNPAAKLPRDDREKRLLRLRRALLLVIFLCYLAGNAYMVFFSRSAAEEFQVQSELFGKLRGSMYIDYGIFTILRIYFVLGYETARNTIHILDATQIFEVYLNTFLYIPLGYLLPYLFASFRERPNLHTVKWGFFLSLFTENVQLLTRRGFYDVDDLVTNTLGTLLGVLLYRQFAYMVEHPGWRGELKSSRRWKARARRSVLGKYASRFSAVRATLSISNEDDARDYYTDKLGFRLKKMILDEDSDAVLMLMQLGGLQLELRCDPAAPPQGKQYLTLNVKSFDRMYKRMTAQGLSPSPVFADPYSGRRCCTLEAPENVTVTLME